MENQSNLKTVEIKRFQCRHIFTDGHRCGSPALREENFCYYHHTTRKAVADPYHLARRKSRIELPMPEDRASLLLSIGEVLQAIASKAIDDKQARLLLWGLQVAGSALPREAPAGIGTARANSRTQPRSGTCANPAPGDHEKLAPVEDIVEDLHLGIMAEPAEFVEPEEREGRRTLAQQLLDEVERYEAQKEEEDREQDFTLRLQLAVRAASEEAYEKATAECYANLEELVASIRDTAIAETEARMRSALMPTQTETTEILPVIRATADPQCLPDVPAYLCRSRRKPARNSIQISPRNTKKEGRPKAVPLRCNQLPDLREAECRQPANPSVP